MKSVVRFGCFLRCEVDYLDRNRAILNRHPPNARQKIKAPRTGGTRIYDPAPLSLRDQLLVRVPVDDDIGAITREQFGRRWTSHFVTVADVNTNAADLDLDRLG